MREFASIVAPFVVVHALVQLALGLLLGQMGQALVAMAVLPVVLAVAGAVSAAVVEMMALVGRAEG